MAVKTQTGVCALCHKTKELRDSHIASKFLWRQSGVIGAGKAFNVESSTHPELNDLHRQDGLKEFLLCHDCEQQFGRYETYAAQALFGNSGPVKIRPGRHFVWTGLDYRRLKLFQMSILWRMGVSSLPFYSRVELGKHDDILRGMLKAEDPGEPWQYGCIVTLLDIGGKPLSGLFSQPLKTKKFGHHCYRYVMSGIRWVQFATSHLPETDLAQAFLQLDGRWILFRGEITDFSELRAQVKMYYDYHQQAHQVEGTDAGDAPE